MVRSRVKNRKEESKSGKLTSPTSLGYHSYMTGPKFKMADTETHDDFISTSLNDPNDVDNRFVS